MTSEANCPQDQPKPNPIPPNSNGRRKQAKPQRKNVEIDEELEGANMVASSCNSQETVVDSGVDSEATTPSSPEDEASEETEKSSSKEESALSNDEMVLETAETLLALSGKKPTGTAASSQKDTAVVLPQQPQDDAKGEGETE